MIWALNSGELVKTADSSFFFASTALRGPTSLRQLKAISTTETK
jgi:hypothetical protein